MYKIFQGLTAEEMIRKLPEDQIRHCVNVEILVGKLVEWLPISKETFPNHIYLNFSRAAYYHDIGKVCVPDYILNKIDALTWEEYDIVRRHPVYGEELLNFCMKNGSSGIPPCLLPLTKQAALYHHEWWNGKGYPFGIRERKIPYVARVTSICDAYDAMVSNRPYHRAYSHEYACEEVRRGAGTQFDPALAKVFLEHETEISHIVGEICTYSTDKLIIEKKRLLYSRQN
ncbi:HD-GYP domain-containing protein [Anaerotignum sp.]|uniref:HD-GYP domain-containing protein n=1 Tax=Anaerotignum sp. TaxID=2039241 RepID=UPI002714CDE8|nr:HD domain-containing phosphohydrolase [Anaerotignum sp.]